MTERKKLSLSRPAPADSSDAPARRKPPVRGAGSAPRKRMTAAEAAQAREEAARAPRSEPVDRPRHDSGEGWPARRTTEPRRPAQGDERGRPPARPAPQGGRGDARRPMERPAYPERAPRAEAQPTARPERQAERPVPDDGRIRLSKLMSERGLASRREADEWIEQGWVRVDGEVVAELGVRVLPNVDITIDPLARTQQAERVTILLHKPIGYVSGQAEDGHEPAVALIRPENRWREDRHPLQLTRGHLRNLAPAGRLDIDSTGLLVLTQDGRVARQLIGEDSGIEKEYLVRVQSVSEPDAENVSAVVSPETLERLRFGLELDGRQLKPAQVSWQNEQQLRFVLREGRKRQIRRMCELVGLKVVGLKRVRMGRITLSKLPQGQWRFLRPDERF